MEIWLIQDGKKSGPFQDYEIRSRIADGQIDSDVFAWHEGLPGWIKLSEIELFRKEIELAELDRATTTQIHRSAVPPQIPSSMPIQEKHHFGRRFWARWCDLFVYAAVWWLLLYVADRDIKEVIMNLWLQLTIFIPWFAIEAWMLHQFGTTPGKWLLGIRVVNEDDTRLSLKSSIWRSIRVMIAGIGFGWSFLSILCQAMSWFSTRRIGRPIWDYMGRHKLVVTPLKPLRVIMLILLFFVSMQLQIAVRSPHDQEILIELYPEFKELFEKSQPWHLPVRK